MVSHSYTQTQLTLIPPSMPLYHFVTDDLPAKTEAPELDDTNATTSLLADAQWTGDDRSAGSTVTKELVGRYLKYLGAVNFLPPPSPGKGADLPGIELSKEQRAAMEHIGGRGATT